MAMTHDYLDFLNEKVGIAPANSQEELQAAQTIAHLMGQHEVDPQIEEFDTPAVSGLVPAITSVVMFVGIVLAGIGVLPLTIIGFLLALVPAVLAGLRFLGREVNLAVGPKVRSQNVIAFHRATGPLVAKGNRPIVVVAHYDTPHQNFLYTTPVAPYIPLLSKASRYCVLAVAFCAFVQILLFIPAAGRVFFWIVGILAALPCAVIAAGTISERFMGCTDGANSNKAGVAALLGVLENVRPSGLTPTERPSKDELVAAQEAEQTSYDEFDEVEEPAAEPQDFAAAPQTAFVSEPERPAAPAPAPEPAPVVEVLGVRHGEKVLRSLGMLPQSCQIVYQLGEQPAAPTQPEQPAAPAPGATSELGSTTSFVSADKTAEVAVPAEPNKTDDLGATREQLLSTGRFSLDVDDEGSHGVGSKDSSGLTNLSGLEDDANATQAAPAPRPEAPSDPEWGKSGYRPQLSSVARRASLFDLPDPSAADSDPFATDPQAKPVEVPPTRQAAAPVSAPVAAPQPIETLTSTPEAKPGAAVLGFFDRLKEKVASRRSASLDAPGDAWLGEDDGDDDPMWRGGAATRSGLRLVEDAEDSSSEAGENGEGALAVVPSDDEMRDEVLKLSDDALISHDIWFVALGASSLDHAGMRAFLADHRSDIRGAFVVNLDCVGAGALTALTHEGLENTRRADRRLLRLLGNAARDLHADLDQKRFDWTSTDATPAMQASRRAVTLVGLDANGLPALDKTLLDTPENVDGDQAADVAAIVTEMIRRS